MPITPDMPTPDNDETPAGAGRNAAAKAANDRPDADDFDDGGDIYEDGEEDELEAEAGGQSFSDMVRQAPIGAVIGAFIAGFLVSRLM